MDETELAYAELQKNEKPMMTFVGALVGCLPATVIYVLFASMGGVLAFFLFIPGIVIGYFARFVGRPFNLKPRLLVGFLAFILHCFATYYIGFSPLIYILAPVCFAVAVTFSKVKLSRLQEFAIGQAEIGKIGSTKQIHPTPSGGEAN
jgi:hypothetical protein